MNSGPVASPFAGISLDPKHANTILQSPDKIYGFLKEKWSTARKTAFLAARNDVALARSRLLLNMPHTFLGSNPEKAAAHLDQAIGQSQAKSVWFSYELLDSEISDFCAEMVEENQEMSEGDAAKNFVTMLNDSERITLWLKIKLEIRLSLEYGLLSLDADPKTCMASPAGHIRRLIVLQDEVDSIWIKAAKVFKVAMDNVHTAYHGSIDFRDGEFVQDVTSAVSVVFQDNYRDTLAYVKQCVLEALDLRVATGQKVSFAEVRRIQNEAWDTYDSENAQQTLLKANASYLAVCNKVVHDS
ncbi:hypothetical protein COL26b_014297 [Colletotrichum chrysophilum]|uniref:uncharacterized protein n=1 Tax=Colletotrichum chrysophilum TaxID=1836956 RepID=UPI0022FFE8F8|nr:uncharacterized protein COL26b_014297 [Colletotrichum chrysophilum]KAJ0359677.1 hypothetical protein COL26b_014297 [Colletotrichum chrysophilum]